MKQFRVLSTSAISTLAQRHIVKLPNQHTPPVFKVNKRGIFISGSKTQPHIRCLGVRAAF